MAITKNEASLDRALQRLWAAGATWRVVRNSSKLWITQGTAQLGAFTRIVAEIEAAGQGTYIYTPHDDDDDPEPA